MTTTSFETSVTINISPGRLYDYVSDFPRHVTWNGQPQAITPQPEGLTAVGNRYRTEESSTRNITTTQEMMFSFAMPTLRGLDGIAPYSETEIVALEPDRRATWKARLPGTPKKAI